MAAKAPAKAPAKTAAQIAAEKAEAAKQAAIREINSKVPGLANPEKYVTAKNTANLAGAREAYIKENLKLEPAPFKASGYSIAAARTAAPNIAKFQELGMTDFSSAINAKGEFVSSKAEESLIKDVYKLDPAAYKSAPRTVADTTKPKVYDRATGKYDYPKITIQNYDIAKANQKYQFEQPKIKASLSSPSNFSQAIANYSDALSSIRNIGVENINDADYATIQSLARTVRDFDSKELSQDARSLIANSTQAIDSINEIRSQRKIAERQQERIMASPAGPLRQTERGKAFAEQEKLQRLIDTANTNTPKYIESFSRFGLSDVVSGIGSKAGDLRDVDTGIAGLREKSFFDVKKSDFFGKVNSEVTDEQILNDINTQSKAEAKRLYDLGTAATTDLQSQITQANQFLSDLPATDPRRAETQKTIDSLTSQLTEAQKDTLEAKNLFDNYQPVSGERATSALSKFRQSLLQPEQRTLKQIEEIDPQLFKTIQELGKQYNELLAQPVGPTTSESTEALRRDTEGRIAAQLALGSQLGAEERRQYEQAARGAQTARGNIFGVAPAVEEAVTTGLAGEQRLQARLGAAQGFLSSGQSVSDALARDVGFRNALQQSRLGAAADFAAGGPTAYNMANARAGQQANMISQYVGAALPQQTGGFAATPSASTPYGYVDPQAGFRGAQNAAQLYGTLANIYNTQASYLSDTYGAQTRAQASTYTSPSQAFGNVASGLGNLFSFSKAF